MWYVNDDRTDRRYEDPRLVEGTHEHQYLIYPYTLLHENQVCERGHSARHCPAFFPLNHAHSGALPAVLPHCERDFVGTNASVIGLAPCTVWCCNWRWHGHAMVLVTCRPGRQLQYYNY